LFFTAPRELLEPLLERFQLQLVPPPLAVAPIPVAAVWHERYSADPAQRFFRELVQFEVAAVLRRKGGQRQGRQK
jgi:DNA-binding transcriptional LysR family regulator